ncbi:uncharacterized protein DUF222 [Branchiibius hedensis]|uniref:HNH nuclease domain-containing protein n=1 Tax=Branchiibius hedensis TaxID=672460 RepID=A0A2Y9C1G0_9MICO|nr:HNH endonuclease signature motif containing protein [Branchiibius hedensis]PWJ25450.1 uncharacterized protein DUF222 [Branchiibius hedensis]SSA34263.1 protein of unknown function [Branchiibius hedensis]
MGALLDELHDVLDRFAALDSWDGSSVEDARRASGRLASAKARIDGVLVSVASALRSAVTSAGGSVAEVSSIMSGEFGGDRRDAQALVNLGEQLQHAPATGSRLSSGGVSREQAGVIARGLAALPDSVAQADRDAAERALLEAAPTMTLVDLRRRATRMREAFEDVAQADAHEDAVLVDQEQAAWAQASFWMREHKPGLFKGGFTLPELQAQMLKTMLEGISAPRRFHLETGNHGGGAGRARASGGRANGRRATGSGAAGGEGHEGGPVPPDWARGSEDAVAEPARGGWARTGAQADAEIDAAELAEAGGLPMDTAHREGRALAQLCEHLPLDKLPGAGGISAVLTVNLDYETLAVGVRAATLSTGGRVSAGEVRRLACGASLIPQVFDGKSLPLDLGRARRLFTNHQRRAAENRYGGCAFPGCDRPPGWTEGHHWREPWAAGGTTNLDDLAPLCASHHRRVHYEHIPARLRDGVLEFFVAPRGGGPKEWRSNNRWRVGPLAR